jgi:hypothetical protein
MKDFVVEGGIVFVVWPIFEQIHLISTMPQMHHHLRLLCHLRSP